MLCIKNGTIINANRTQHADILICEAKIIEIAENLQLADKNIEVIDASDKFILPGAIDPHVHLNLPTPAGYSSDNFFTGSRAALAGGTTTIIDFVTPESRSESLLAALDKRKKEAENAVCNYAFHMSPLAWNKNVANDIKACITNEGIPSFKTYMAYKQSIGLELDAIESLMAHVSKLKGIMLVHAEDGNEIDKLRQQFIQEGKTGNIYHALSRPAEVEEAAINELLNLIKKTNCKTYIVHTSSGRSINLIKQAQQENLSVFSETCPQYLLFDDSKLDQPFYDSAPYIFSPSLHSAKHKNHLWKGITNKIITSIGTDHCPFNLHGQKDLGLNDFTKVPNGAGGIEHRLELLYTFGVLTGKISMQQMVNLVSTQPAKLFGLNSKGIIDINYDADLVIWNKSVNKTISSKNQWQNCDHNIYEGLRIKGEAKQVIMNGQVVYSKSEGFRNPKGSYLFRSIS